MRAGTAEGWEAKAPGTSGLQMRTMEGLAWQFQSPPEDPSSFLGDQPGLEPTKASGIGKGFSGAGSLGCKLKCFQVMKVRGAEVLDNREPPPPPPPPSSADGTACVPCP